MYKTFFSLIVVLIMQSLSATPASANGRIDTIPAGIKGDFVDDYGIRYSVSDSLWFQHPRARFHIIEWNTEKQYILAKNDNSNPTEPGLFTRIDYVMLPNMGEWTWGFCLTVYNATSEADAMSKVAADRANPRKGCNGFPFSRLKRQQNAN